MNNPAADVCFLPAPLPPRLSRTLLSQRLKQLEWLGVVESVSKSERRGHPCELTSAGRDLFAAYQSPGE